MTEQYSTATLKSFDGSEVFSFSINPEAISYDLAAEFSVLPVLATAQPQVKYKTSGMKLEIPVVKFWSDNNDRDLSPDLDRLAAWTRPDPAQAQPKLLKFQWGQEVYPRVYLIRFPYKVTQRRNGLPTQAQGSMTLLLAPEPPKPTLDPAQIPLKLSARERESYLQQVKDKLKADRSIAAKYPVDPKEVLAVAEDGTVTATLAGKVRTVAKVSDILGVETLRPGHRESLR